MSAVRREIDVYAAMAGSRPVTSFYIGGGTPTTTLHHGLVEMIGHVRGAFNLQCDIHMESHPNRLSAANLRAIRSMGVQHLSIGVEALVDRHLKALCRPYTVSEAREAVRRAVAAGFACVNVDVMFALPGQTRQEVAMTGRELVALGVDQVVAYPLFLFPYTPLGRATRARTSVWAFTRRGVPRYRSVTVPLYVGLGASGGTYLRDVFHLNTFSAAEYVEVLEAGRMPIALSIDLSERMQRVGWLYWRIYETAFSRAEYRARFSEEIDRAYGRYLRLWRLLGFLKDDGKRIVLSDRGAFWLHAFENIASIGYISTLWGAARRDCWPGQVALQ